MQKEFFKFTKNRRAEITTDDVLQTMFDLALSLIHAEKGFLFECSHTGKPKFKFGKNTKEKLVSENQLSRTDRQMIDEAIKLREMKIALNGPGYKSGKLSPWRRIAVPLVAGKSGELQNNGMRNDGLLGVCYFFSEKKANLFRKENKNF